MQCTECNSDHIGLVFGNSTRAAGRRLAARLFEQYTSGISTAAHTDSFGYERVRDDVRLATNMSQKRAATAVMRFDIVYECLEYLCTRAEPKI